MTDFAYGRASASKLRTCNKTLQDIAMLAIKLTPVDFTIVHGWRGEEEQNELFRTRLSKTPWPDSKHNHFLKVRPTDENADPEGFVMVADSLAIDFAPWVNGDIPWDDTHLFAVIAGVWFAAADQHGAVLRWGGDWDMDGLTTDQTFMDWGHMELKLGDQTE